MFRLETPRLVLRRFQDSDLEPFVQYRSDPDVVRYQSWELPFPKEKALEFIVWAKNAQPARPGEWFQAAIERKDSGQMIGDCGLYLLPDGQQAEMGITLDKAHWGQGYAREALERVLEYFFAELGLHRVRASTDVENHSSWHLMVKLGMRLEGTFVQSLWFKGRWSSEYWYAILQEEWHKRHARG